MPMTPTFPTVAPTTLRPSRLPSASPARPRRPTRAAAPLLLAAVLLAAGCATSSPDVVARHEAQRLSTVADAVVLSTRPVVVDGTQSGIGSTAGGVVGGIAGSSVGGRREGFVVGVIGAVIGGVIGNSVERATTSEDAVEILLQLRSGERRAVVQARAAETFAPGDAVLLVTTGGRVRVMRAPAPMPRS